MEYSASESARFGMAVYRATLRDLDPEALCTEIREKDIDLAILRLPAEKQAQLAALQETGLPFLVADTLVRYSADLEHCEPVAPGRDLDFRACRPDETRELAAMVEEIFSGYANHYRSNPHLPPEGALAGYVEWAQSYVADRDPARRCWLACRKDRPVGFVACALHGDTAEIVLNGVRPRESGSGVYTGIVRFVQAHYKAAGARRLLVATQVHNLVVQRAWLREGLLPSEALVTIHVNAFLAKKR